MKNIAFLCVVCVAISAVTLFAQENMTKFDQSPIDPSTMGYTKKFVLPDQGLNEDERKYLEIAKIINDILSEEQNIVVITKKMARVLEILEPTIKYRIIRVDFQTSATTPAGSLLRQINVLTTDKKDVFTFQVSIDTRDTIAHLAISRKDKSSSMGVSFHANGLMSNLSYRNETFAKIKREVTWSEDGKLIQKRAIEKPEPLRITKGSEKR